MFTLCALKAITCASTSDEDDEPEDRVRLLTVDYSANDDPQNGSTGYNATESSKDTGNTCTAEGVHLYRRRWLMLLLFFLFSLSNAEQWIHLNIISHVISRYYNASLPSDEFQRANAIDWLSMVYMLTYIPLIFPATWILDKKGLKVCMIAGSCLNAIAAWLKCASVREDLFPLLMFAQTLAAISQIWILGIPARLAAVWFGPKEVSTATAIGVFGNQVGIAVGFLVPPMLVPDSDTVDEIGTDLRNMFYGTAAVTSVVLLLNIVFFQKEPPRPPSRAQQQQVELEANANYGQSLLRLVKNKGFIVLMISYGMNTGSFYAVSTVLSTIILDYFKGEDLNAGRIGLTLVLAGIIGSIAAGVWLDRTRTFKGTSLGIYIMTTASMAAFTFTLSFHHIWIAFVTGGLLGLTMTGYLPVGFEFAAELTFPESEGTSSGLLNASAQMFGIALTFGMRVIAEKVSVFWANVMVTIILLLGTVMTCFIKADYRRQRAGQVIVEKIANVEVQVADDTNSPPSSPETANSHSAR